MSARMHTRKDALVADGVEFYRRMLAELLRGHGWRVAEAQDGGQALECLEQERPDVVFLDLGLPPDGAQAFLGRVQERGWHGLRVVALAPGLGQDGEADAVTGLAPAAVVGRTAPIDDLLVAARSALFPEEKNLRRSPRAQARVPIGYRAEGPDGELGPETTSHSFNLSADGAFLTASGTAPAPPGTRLELRFWLPGAPEVIATAGVVIWCNQAGTRVNPLYPPGMGVMFLGLKREAAVVIGEYVRDRASNNFH